MKTKTNLKAGQGLTQGTSGGSGGESKPYYTITLTG
jgi:hypothetical protein